MLRFGKLKEKDTVDIEGRIFQLIGLLVVKLIFVVGVQIFEDFYLKVRKPLC